MISIYGNVNVPSLLRFVVIMEDKNSKLKESQWQWYLAISARAVRFDYVHVALLSRWARHPEARGKACSFATYVISIYGFHKREECHPHILPLPVGLQQCGTLLALALGVLLKQRWIT